MDRITRSLLDSFSENNETKNYKESKQFEYFVNFSVISKNYRNSFNLEDTDTGEGGDGAIDGIAIIINGKLISSIEELNDIVVDSGYLDCNLYIIQSKISQKFEGTSIASFVFGVKDFISDNPQLVQNENIKKYHEIWEEIILKSSYMTNRLPTLKLFYVTTGKWVSDKNLEAIRSSGESEIDQTGLFSSVNIEILGATEIQRLYHETKNKLSTTITFQNRITLPDIKNITESYLGYVTIFRIYQINRG